VFDRPKGSKNYWSAFSYQGQEYRKFSEKNNARQGFFEQEEFEMMVSLLPPYLKDVTRFAYHTGWRKTEILTLEWCNIHGDVIRLGPEIAKNKDGRVLVIVGELANILARRQAERVESCPYVFHREGMRIKHYNRAWHTARQKAGLPGKFFHDALGTVVRNMDRAGGAPSDRETDSRRQDRCGVQSLPDCE